ncbi:hypothetical protein FGE12_09570 [Aggregicoccus sp. 17bor-14]|uniref:hypothetical protein n=1 Tax=Myxococcaceae TaxID=31 RepID=UPI00129D18AF|nr:MULTISPECIES: hypothetical protein [Myxococcaceae]MBF5042648.1 hypothetical protein [Simulacricoccus sp. 17bor-14]MRI88416.1 hypothetical protein [Aggregicoccus sp. 17bor-14]
MTSLLSSIEPLRVRLRRAQFIFGLGVLSMVLGSIASAGLSLRLGLRVAELPQVLRWAVAIGVGGLWRLSFLPLLCYGAARVLALRPRATAVGAALSGEAFLLALDLTRAGVAGLWTSAPLVLGRLGTLALGMWLSERAVQAGRLAAEAQERAAQAKAQATQAEYAEFLARAEGAPAEDVRP